MNNTGYADKMEELRNILDMLKISKVRFLGKRLDPSVIEIGGEYDIGGLTDALMDENVFVRYIAAEAPEIAGMGVIAAARSNHSHPRRQIYPYLHPTPHICPRSSYRISHDLKRIGCPRIHSGVAWMGLGLIYVFSV